MKKQGQPEEEEEKKRSFFSVFILIVFIANYCAERLFALEMSGKGSKKHVRNVLRADDAPQGTFAVIDPYSTKVFVPLESMLDTRALHRDGVPSLCRIFLEGRCRQGTNCFQAHADPAVVATLRAAALSQPTCCHLHGVPVVAGVPQHLTVAIREDNGRELTRLPVDRLAVTNGLTALLEAQKQDAPPETLTRQSSEVVVPMSSLCRLHGGQDKTPCCRFGSDCNFVHVCREILPTLVSPKMPVDEEMPEVLSTAGAVGEPIGNSPSGNQATVVTGITTPVYLRPPIALAMTAPSNGPHMSASPSMARSFSSTASGLVWRHNPYGSSVASSAIET